LPDLRIRQPKDSGGFYLLRKKQQGVRFSCDTVAPSKSLILFAYTLCSPS
jgi:hypothetical protein